MSERDPWTDHAACADMPKDAFFPTLCQPWERSRAVARAVAVCARCPVRDECHAEAVARRERDGVWGGRDFTSYRGPLQPRECARPGCDTVFEPKRSHAKWCSARCQRRVSDARRGRGLVA